MLYEKLAYCICKKYRPMSDCTGCTAFFPACPKGQGPLYLMIQSVDIDKLDFIQPL